MYEYYVKDTGEVFYVGKGKGLRARRGRRNKFCEDMKSTHDWDYRIVFDCLTEDDAFHKEMELISLYRENTNFRLTNVTIGGDGVSGWIPNKQFREKQSMYSKSRWNNPEFRDRITSARNSPDSTYQSTEFKEKISKLVSGENNPNYRNHWTDDQKRRLSAKRKQNGKSKDTLNGRAKAIRCVETGEEFALIKDAAEKYKVTSPTSFSVALDNPNRTAAKLHWVTISPQ